MERLAIVMIVTVGGRGVRSDCFQAEREKKVPRTTEWAQRGKVDVGYLSLSVGPDWVHRVRIIGQLVNILGRLRSWSW